MNETREPEMDALEAMFRRRESDVVSPMRLPRIARRHARFRQMGTVALTAALVIAVVGAIVLVPRPSPTDPATDAPVAPRTSTIDGVTITYPSDWYLVALPQITLNGPDASYRPVLQLSSFDPNASGRQWLCPLPTGTIPQGGVLLYVEAVAGPGLDPAPDWPVPFPSEPSTAPGLGACGGNAEVPRSLWNADGVMYAGSILGDPTDPSIGGAFSSMRFAGGTSAELGQADPGLVTQEGYVLDAGPGWRLQTASLEAGVSVSTPGLLAVAMDATGDRDTAGAGWRPSRPYAAGLLVGGPSVLQFGLVDAKVASVAFVPAVGDVVDLPLRDLPAAAGGDQGLQAYWGLVPVGDGFISLVRTNGTSSNIGREVPTVVLPVLPDLPTGDGSFGMSSFDFLAFGVGGRSTMWDGEPSCWTVQVGSEWRARCPLAADASAPDLDLIRVPGGWIAWGTVPAQVTRVHFVADDPLVFDTWPLWVTNGENPPGGVNLILMEIPARPGGEIRFAADGGGALYPPMAVRA